MNKILKDALLMLVAGTFAVSCADYNETDNFTAQPDPTVTTPYNDLNPVKSYINRGAYPNMSLDAALNIKDFKEQALAHAAAVANFDRFYFGTAFMSGSIINAKGVLNFIDMKEQLDHVQEIGGEVYGSAIAANTGQADGWLSYLTAPVEIIVEYKELLAVDFSKGDPYTGTGGKLVTKNGETVLQISSKSTVVEGFEVEPKSRYTTQLWVRADKGKTATFTIVFSGSTVDGPVKGKYSIEGSDEWTRITIDEEPAEGVEEGYLRIEPARGSTVFVKKAQIGVLPDNHREQTLEEKRDTLRWGMGAWCDGLMKNNAGRMKSFDLIEEALGTTTLDGSDILDLKHSTDKIYWQDYFDYEGKTGSELYAPIVSDSAIAAFKKYGGNPDDLKFFICERGLDATQRFNSLMHWINVWKQNGAKIDGINAKVSLVFDEDDNSTNEAAFDKLLDNLKSSGLRVRISNFDITYQAGGENVAAKDITSEQRQKLADYNAKLIKKYLTTIDPKLQAGICKGNIVDTTDPVGLWANETVGASKTKDWVRTATYKAYCDALK